MVTSVFGVLAGTVLTALPVPGAMAATGINKQINFQGKVTNTNGTNVANGSYSFTFRLYSVASAGTALWTETKTLTVTDGVFQTNLGSTTALPGSVDFNTDNIYLGMAFNGDPEMTPRIQFTAAPYAFNSDKLQGLSAADFAQLNPGSAQSGSLNVTGSVQAATSLQAPLVDTATAVALNIGTGTATSVTIGRITTPFLVQGNSSSTFTATSGANTTTVGFTTPTAARSILFPDAGGTICTTVASTCSATYVTAGNFLSKNAADTSSFAVTAANYLYGFTNTSSAVASGVLKLDNGNNTGSGLTVVGSGNPAAGQALILANAATGVTGNLIDLQVNAASRFSVNQAGAVTTASTINSQTISATASFTGTVQAATSFIAPLHTTADVASGTSAGITIRSGNATGGNGGSGNVTLDNGAKNGTGFAGNLYIGNTNAANVNIGRNAATASGVTVSIQGLAATSSLIFNDGTNTNQTTVSFTTPTAARSIVFPDAGGTVCTTTASTCNTTYQPYSANGYLARNSADTSSTSVAGYLYGFTNSNSGAAGVLSLTGAGTNSALSVTQSGNPASGQAVILATNTNGTPSGNLLDLRVTAGSRFSVDTAGAVLTSSTINGQTISSSASFTGTVTSATGMTVTSGGITVGGNSSITGTLGVSNTLTVSAGGASISGGLNNNTGNITNAGAISGATSITASGTIQGGGTFKSADTTASSAVSLTSGNASSGNSGAVSIDSGAATGTAGAITVAAANSTAVTIGRSGATAPTITLQGDASSQFQINNGTNYSRIQFTAPTAQVAYTLGTNATNTSAAICTSLAASCNTTYQPYIASGYLVKSPTSNEASSSNFTGYQYTFTQSSGTSAGNLSLINSGLNAALLVTQATNPSAGQAGIVVNNSNGTPSGNLIDLQAGGASQFAVDAAGNISTLAGASSGKINGQTISSTASFTGTVTSASGITVTSGGISVGGNSSITGTLGVSNTLTVTSGGASISGGINNNAGGITNAGAVSGLSSLQFNTAGTIDTNSGTSITIGGTNANAITIGKSTATQPAISLQGSASSVFTATGASGSTTLAFATLSAAGRTVTIPNETGTICTSASTSTANCTNFAPATLGTGYIQNQIAAQQSSSNFWISAVGRADTSFLAPTFDTATAVNLNIGASGGPTATQINLNQNTVLASGKSLTVQGALTQSGGALSLAGNAASSITTTSGNALTITSAAAATWSTSAGALTVTSAAAATWSTATGALTVDSAAALNLGTSAATSLSVGKTGITTIINGTTQVGASAGTGDLVNNGTTKNATLALSNLNYSGSGNTGAIGTAAATVDIYTAFTINQTTSGQTLTIPTPTAGAAASTGRIIYISNIGSVSFTLLGGGAILNAGSTATLIFNGTAWTFAGVDSGGIQNQNTSDQTANFRISGVGQASTSFRGPLFDAISASTLNIGTGTANAINIGSTGITTNILGTFTVGTGTTGGTGAFVNNGTTLNKTLAISNLATGGALGTAAATVDIYTSFTVNQTTARQTIPVPTPTVGAAASTGRVIYVANIGSVSFTLLSGGATLNPGSTATLVFNGTAWTFAGADGSGIQNQTTVDQAASYRITGTGVLGSGLQIGGTAYCASGCGDLNFATGANRTLKVLAAASGNGGNSLTLQAGDGNGTNQAGGALLLQGGAATGTGAGGVVTVRSQSNSATAFTVQNASSVAQFTVDTTNSIVMIGDSTNGATFSSTRELTLNGTARHQKAIRLTAEYAGAVLDAGGQTSVTGTMTAGYDATQRFGYYKWTSGLASANTYDVVVTIPVPDDWSAWNGNPQFKTYASSIAAGNTVNVVSITRTDGSADTTFTATNITPGSTSTWATYSSKGLDTSGYTAGGSMNIRLRMSSLSNSDIRLADIILPYYAKY